MKVISLIILVTLAFAQNSQEQLRCIPKPPVVQPPVVQPPVVQPPVVQPPVVVAPVDPSTLTNKQRRQNIKNKPFKSIAYINTLNQSTHALFLQTIGIGSPYDVINFCFWAINDPNINAGNLPYLDRPEVFVGHFYQGVSNPREYILNEIRDAFRRENKLLFVSLFGANDYITPDVDPVKEGYRLADWVNTKPFIDGIDFDFEDNGFFQNPKNLAITWLVKFQTALQERLVDKDILITHAPQGPYFSAAHYKLFGVDSYVELHKRIGDKIDWYNVQFYNQGNCAYNTYESLFIKGASWCVDSAFQEIQKNVPIEKIVIGKPVTSSDVYNTGLITATSLATYINQYVSQTNQKPPGFFIWALNSDANWNFVKTLQSEVTYARAK